jgi:hypothetical protein
MRHGRIIKRRFERTDAEILKWKKARERKLANEQKSLLEQIVQPRGSSLVAVKVIYWWSAPVISLHTSLRYFNLFLTLTFFHFRTFSEFAPDEDFRVSSYAAAQEKTEKKQVNKQNTDALLC